MSKQTILTIAWLSIVSFFVLLFLVVILPNDLKQFYTEDRQGILDTRFMYLPSDVLEVATTYQQAGRDAYIKSKLTIDLGWPIIYGLFLISWLRLIKKPVYVQTGMLFIGSALVFDFIENASLALYFAWYESQVFTLALVASIATPMKWFMLIVSVIFVVSGFIFHRKYCKLTLF